MDEGTMKMVSQMLKLRELLDREFTTLILVTSSQYLESNTQLGALKSLVIRKSMARLQLPRELVLYPSPLTFAALADPSLNGFSWVNNEYVDIQVDGLLIQLWGIK